MPAFDLQPVMKKALIKLNDQTPLSAEQNFVRLIQTTSTAADHLGHIKLPSLIVVCIISNHEGK